MIGYGKHPPLRNAADPSDLVWNWFILNGPHGERFAWHREVPRGRKDLQVLADSISTNSSTNPRFESRLREIALQSLEMNDPVLIRKAIQVLTVVGTDEDMLLVRELLKHPSKAVAKDARSALFERRL